MNQPSRRKVAAGIAWSIPAITVGAAAPAVAASQVSPSINRSFYITRSSSGCSSGSRRLTVDSKNDGTSYYQIVNVSPTSSVTAVYASVLVNLSGLSFTTTTGNWSAVQQDSQTYSYNGVTYYRYFAKLQVAIPAPVNGTITVPSLSWVSNCTASLSNPVSVNGRGMVTINGQDIEQVGPFRTL
ncbi:hypothetical protein EDC82_0197 [Dermacoccus sp. SAI-028]|uniref:hypothetical protein n=1 Tax=unclassified Dermacoccus TaxID=2643059 RepID=UPI000AE8170C|nr:MULTISPECIES: hypothetical protein [unclassified Dermacoccus]TCJ90487.1 hypothetical protein EDC82_0197 [Dermacoccus sp. SAI-028]